MNWSLAKFGLLITAVLAVYAHFSTSGGLYGYLYSDKTVLWQEIDLSDYPEIVYEMDQCLAEYATWQEARPGDPAHWPDPSENFSCSANGSDLSAAEQRAITKWIDLRFLSNPAWQSHSEVGDFNAFYYIRPTRYLPHVDYNDLASLSSPLSIFQSSCGHISSVYFDVTAIVRLSGQLRHICF